MKGSLLLFLTLVIIFHSACTGHKFLPPGERYYDGAEVTLKPLVDIPRSDLKETKKDELEIFKLSPNKRFLGMRPTVWFYHLAGDVEKEKGFRHWLKYKVGKRPVYFSELDVVLTEELVRNRLELNGFYNYDVTYEIDSSRHKASIEYIARLTAPYRLDTINRFSQDSLAITRVINGFNNETLLETGARYDFEEFQNERIRIEEDLRNLGYYYFDDRNILFEADSTVGNRKVNVYPKIKPAASRNSLQQYKINDVFVHANFNWNGKDTLTAGLDTVEVSKMKYISSEDRFDPEAITSVIAIEPGAMYSRNAELITLNRLIHLDVFRFVNVNFEDLGTDRMNAHVYLSPMKQNSIQFQVDAVATSNNFAGPHARISWLNRNIFKGAERYQLNIYSGYEWQIGGGSDESLNNYEFGIENVLTFPRLIQPFRIRYESARFLPETKVKLGARFQRRVGYYQMNSLNSQFGYEWKQSITKRHSLYPAVINYIDLGKTTLEFDSILNENPILARSYEEQFIVGASYGFYFSSMEDKLKQNRRNNFYFNTNLDISGNLVYMINKAVGTEVSSETGNYTLLGQPYSQFFRASVDFRHYFDITESSQFASRLITGVGYSYGNSVTIPYSYQYSVGGSNSLRGFRARAVGPGTFVPDSSVTFIDQTGDIKLEMNFEYRFEILGPIKGAVFTDIGNVWALREDPERPGAQFKWNTFLQQLAMDVGLGVRYDLKIFVLRLDVGWPVKLAHAYTNEEGEEERFRLEFWKKDWRKEYLVWNIAIGYPF